MVDGQHRKSVSSPDSRCVIAARPARDQAFTACAFSQSFRNFSRPMLVSGWLNS
jgi:hypothetical protein